MPTNQKKKTPRLVRIQPSGEQHANSNYEGKGEKGPRTTRSITANGNSACEKIQQPKKGRGLGKKTVEAKAAKAMSQQLNPVQLDESTTFSSLQEMFPEVICEQNKLLVEDLLSLLRDEAALEHSMNCLAKGIKSVADLDAAKVLATLSNSKTRLSQRKHQLINDLGLRADRPGKYDPAIEQRMGINADQIPLEGEAVSWMN